MAPLQDANLYSQTALCQLGFATLVSRASCRPRQLRASSSAAAAESSCAASCAASRPTASVSCAGGLMRHGRLAARLHPGRVRKAQPDEERVLSLLARLAAAERLLETKFGAKPIAAEESPLVGPTAAESAPAPQCEPSPPPAPIPAARPVELRPSPPPASTFEHLGSNLFAVTAAAAALNDTLDQSTIFRVTERDGETPYVAPSGPDAPLTCESCGRCFGASYTRLMSHQGKPCTPPPPDPSSVEDRPLLVHFARYRLPLIGPFLSARGLSIHVSSDASARKSEETSSTEMYFATRASTLTRTLRELNYAECSSCNLEAWYDEFAADRTTAQSVVLSLTDDELRCLQRMHGSVVWGSMLGSRPDRGHEHQIDALTRRVGEALASAGGGAFFCKTSMRSPKDAVILDESPENEQAAAKLARTIMAMRVESGEGALSLLARSRRVASDIAFHFKYRTPGTRGDRLNLIFRAFDTSMAVGSVELRCFVSHGRVTAISQYYCYDVLPCLARASPSELSAIRSRVLAFARAVHARVGDQFGERYVLDVALRVQDNDDKFGCSLVEINPFISSGAALFSWDRDRALLEGASSHCGMNSSNTMQNGQEAVAAMSDDDEQVEFRILVRLL